MPVKRPRRKQLSAEQRLARVEAAIAKLTRARVDVRREEHDQVLAALNQLARNDVDLSRHTKDLDIQFKRIAQIQADLDAIRLAWDRMKTGVV